jgi:hypothetical protein
MLLTVLVRPDGQPDNISDQQDRYSDATQSVEATQIMADRKSFWLGMPTSVSDEHGGVVSLPYQEVLVYLDASYHILAARPSAEVCLICGVPISPYVGRRGCVVVCRLA